MELLKMVKNFFNCGNARHNKDGTVDFEVLNFLSLKNIIIPHFLRYPLRGTKYLDFISFKEALWENIIFKHIYKYPLYGSKRLRLNKLLITKELKCDNKHLIQVDKSRQWRPDYKLRVANIWNS
jgi:hypothetical protein